MATTEIVVHKHETKISEQYSSTDVAGVQHLTEIDFTQQVTELTSDTLVVIQDAAIGDSTLSKVAGVPLNAYKLLTTDADNQAIYADAANPEHVNRIIGLSQTAATAGEVVRIQFAGTIRNQGWNLPVGALLFAGLAGELSTVAVGAFSQIVGYVVSPTSIFLQSSLGIIRAN